MHATLRQGDVYWFVDPDGGRHLFIVCSVERLNRGHYVIGIPVTSAKYSQRSSLPTCAVFTAGEYGFSRNCVAPAEAITVTDKEFVDFEAGPAMSLDDEGFARVVTAIGAMMGAECSQ